MAPASSVEVRYLVRFRYLRATDGMLSPRWARYRSEPGGAITGAGGSGFLVASAFTGTNCTPCGFCTAAAGGETRPKPIMASRNTKTVMLAIESLDFESLNWDKCILQRGNLLLLCTGSNLGCQLRRAKFVELTGHGRQGSRALGEVPASLQTIALEEAVGNRTFVI